MNTPKMLLLRVIILTLTGIPIYSYGGGEGKEKKNSEFRISPLGTDSTGVITWKAFNQDGELHFFVEQLQNDRWIKVGEVSSIAQVEINPFTYKPHLNAGENKFRISWVGNDNVRCFSNVIRADSKKEDVFIRIAENNLSISFTGKTPYTIYDPYGTIMVRGVGEKVDISRYKCGTYCVVYDNKVATFEKKTVWLKNSRHPIIREPKPESHQKTKKAFEMNAP